MIERAVNLVKRSYVIVINEGFRDFTRKASRYVVDLIPESYVEMKKVYWVFFPAKISIADLTARFSTEGRAPHSLAIFEKGERKMLKDVLDEVRSSDVFWDVGANLGYYSCFVGQKAEVVAFEPSPVVVEQLYENLEQNDVEAEVYQYALSDSSGTVNLSPGNISRAEESSVEVETIKGDELEERRPTVVKMDIEGGEAYAIEGMIDILSSDECRLFYCEIHPEMVSDYGETLESMISKIEALGFEVEFLNESRNLVKASRI